MRKYRSQFQENLKRVTYGRVKRRMDKQCGKGWEDALNEPLLENDIGGFGEELRRAGQKQIRSQQQQDRSEKYKWVQERTMSANAMSGIFHKEGYQKPEQQTQ